MGEELRDLRRAHSLWGIRLRWLLPLLATLLLSGSTMAEPAPSFPAGFLRHLQDSKQIYVATQRKDGTRSAASPVWFGIIDNQIWFATKVGSHKAGRVKRGSPLFVSVSGKEGPFVKTRAEIVKDGAVADQLGQIYAQKYWMAWVGLHRPSRQKIESGEDVLIHLIPES